MIYASREMAERIRRYFADLPAVPYEGIPIFPMKGEPMIDLNHIFTYHAPRPDQLPKYELLRQKAKEFAQAVVDCTPECADQTVAIRKIEEAVMTANAAIARDGRR